MTKVSNEPKSSFFPQKGVNNSKVNAKDINSVFPKNDADRRSELKRIADNDAQVDISDKIKDFAKIKRAVDASDEIDNKEKIKDLKERISSGRYEVDYDALAEKMLQNEY